MRKKWPTQEKDLSIAQAVMESYAKAQDQETLGLFELVVNQDKKQMNFRLADWVLTLAKHFNALYGMDQGEFVTRQVISRCITQGHTIH